ncbi:MAG: CopD family protein [Pseudomonadota bacterium]
MVYDPYFWLKATHLVFMVAWMSAMVIYPRYKLHQIKSVPGEPLYETMKEASNRLRHIIMTPSILLTWAAGLGMIALNPIIITGPGSGWLHLKLVIVLIISGLHGYFVSLGKKIDRGAYPSSKQLKMVNELPFVMMIFVIFLAVLKPF